jgi:hypothetical protein
MVERGRDILRQLKERTGLTAIQQGLLDAMTTDPFLRQGGRPGHE